MKNYAPLILFVYNRLSKLKLVVNSLKDNPESINTELYIYSDGFKNQSDFKKVQDVRKYINEINGFKKINITYLDTNVGLASNIINGVTDVLSKNDYVIVLEDDIVVEKNFLSYMNNSLKFYMKQNEVAHISSYMYPIDHKKYNLPDFFFLNLATCWGWATYARSWKYLEIDVDKIINEFTPDLIKNFNLNNSYPFFDQLLQNKKGKIRTWAIFWYATLYKNNLYSLHPKKTFSHNIGNDSSGINSPNTKIFDNTEISLISSNFTLDIKYSAEAKNALVDYFNSNKRSLIRRVLNKFINSINI
jgi:hypothetical protein